MQKCIEYNRNDTSIITKFNNFDFIYYNEFQYFCFKNCVFQYLQLTKIENPLLFINVGFQLTLNKETYKIPRYTYTNPLFNMNLFEFGYSPNFQEIFEDNLKNLLLIVITDVYYLPYRKEYLKNHGSHAIFLVSYMDRTVYIMDWYAPHFLSREFLLPSKWEDRSKCYH